MRLEHLFDLDLRYEGEYVVVRPYGGQDGIGYAAGGGRATGPRIEGDVRFSNNPRVRGDGVLLPALDGSIATDDGARLVFSSTGLGRKEENGRPPKDKLVVREPGSEDRIWWGTVNQPIEEENFDGLRTKVVAHLDQADVYVVDAFAGADPAHRIGVRVITNRPYHALFAKTMFIEPALDELEDFEPQAVVLHAPEVEADPAEDATRTEVFVVLHPSRGEVLIGGTFY